jgi:hypothetical protein
MLAKSGVEEDIRKFWLGHENTWRLTWAAKVGRGFQIPAFVPKPIVRKVRKGRQVEEVAKVG